MWSKYEEACNLATEFVMDTQSSLEVEPRLNNFNSIKQELAAKAVLMDELVCLR